MVWQKNEMQDVGPHASPFDWLSIFLPKHLSARLAAPLRQLFYDRCFAAMPFGATTRS